MAASDKDRQRAAAIRKKGARATATDRAWLRAYTERKKAAALERAAADAAASDAAPQPEYLVEPPPPEPRREPPVWTKAPEAPPPPAEPPPPEPGAPSSSSSSSSTSSPHDPPFVATACDIKDCPACRAANGTRLCKVTGERVWPPMSESGSRGLAEAILAGLAFVIAIGARLVTGRAHRVVKADEREVDELARALRDIALRRASWMGAVDDLFGALFVVSTYSTRAYREGSRPLPANAGASSQPAPTEERRAA